MAKKYYCEFLIDGDEAEPLYALQSKWFNTVKDAKIWCETSFDFIRDDIRVDIMEGDFDGEGNYDITKCVYTFKF